MCQNVIIENHSQPAFEGALKDTFYILILYRARFLHYLQFL